jgi:hypothetical protein
MQFADLRALKPGSDTSVLSMSFTPAPCSTGSTGSRLPNSVSAHNEVDQFAAAGESRASSPSFCCQARSVPPPGSGSQPMRNNRKRALHEPSGLGPRVVPTRSAPQRARRGGFVRPGTSPCAAAWDKPRSETGPVQGPQARPILWDWRLSMIFPVAARGSASCGRARDCSLPGMDSGKHSRHAFPAGFD